MHIFGVKVVNLCGREGSFEHGVAKEKRMVGLVFTISEALGNLCVSNWKLLKPVDQPESISTAPTYIDYYYNNNVTLAIACPVRPSPSHHAEGTG